MYAFHNGKGSFPLVETITIKGARVHNLKNIDVEIPLHTIVGIAGVSGSGKSSLALGVLYAEGSRRYLDSLATYTRRRMTHAPKALVDEILHVPAALALHQRPGVPGMRSTFGTSSELLNTLRLLFSRLASHVCPNGHSVPPSLAVAHDEALCCPECGAHFFAPGAEALSFNSEGACPGCGGTGIIRTVDEASLVPDESLTIDEGAVLPWQTLMWSLMKDIARELGVRTNVPFCELTAKERDIVFHGPAVKHHMVYQNKTSGAAGEMDFTYFNAIYTVENALSKVKDEKGMKRVEKFLRETECPDCHGTRLSEAARAPSIHGEHLDTVCAMTLDDCTKWVQALPKTLPQAMQAMAESICNTFAEMAQRLLELGLGYLTLDRSTNTLSTGERQRVQLARAVRNRTTGVLYVLDEPSIGLHPANITGLIHLIHDLVADGNSVILVDHDPRILQEARWILEMGPGAGKKGGTILAQGTVSDIKQNPASAIGSFLQEGRKNCVRTKAQAKEMFAFGRIHLETSRIHTVHPLVLDIPKGRLTVVTGVSGSGKTTLILESLVPALLAAIQGKPLPKHIKAIDAGDIRSVKLIDATPIGINIRSTVATYANIHDELRKVFAKTAAAKSRKLKAGDFSYNTGSLRCATCDGTGSINLDVQFLPDVTIPCPTCHGSRYNPLAKEIPLTDTTPSVTLPELMAMDIDSVREIVRNLPHVYERLTILHDLGLGYLTLGEDTPGLSGGEAQRLKLAGEIGKGQEKTVFVFDEPTIGLHPHDVQTLLQVFQRLIASGATVIVIEHDSDVIYNADYILDMGPLGGEKGGTLVACGCLDIIQNTKESVTGQYLR